LVGKGRFGIQFKLVYTARHVFINKGDHYGG
jgi:hypothetical protein